MLRYIGLSSGLLLALSISAFGQIIDPVGFCNPPATAAACSTATGAGGETIGITGPSFGMFKTGGGTGLSQTPWYLLLAVPDNVGGAPTITSQGGIFTQTGMTADEGEFLPTTKGSIYGFVNPALTGDSSMNASNLFCDGKAAYPCASSNEITAFGKLPTFFEIYEYTFTPAFDSATAYTFNSSGLENGTFLAASGGSNPFSTPFTTTGLADAGPNSPAPEPASVALLATLGLLVGAIYRKRTRPN